MENENWNDREEKGNVAGILILALIYRYTGIKGTALILMPVVLFYAMYIPIASATLLLIKITSWVIKSPKMLETKCIYELYKNK